jgi:hypothetical protein
MFTPIVAWDLAPPISPVFGVGVTDGEIINTAVFLMGNVSLKDRLLRLFILQNPQPSELHMIYPF